MQEQLCCGGVAAVGLGQDANETIMHREPDSDKEYQELPAIRTGIRPGNARINGGVYFAVGKVPAAKSDVFAQEWALPLIVSFLCPFASAFVWLACHIR